MASDNLNELGRSLGRTQHNIDFSRRRIARLFPRVEKLNDFLGSTTLTYKMEFIEDGCESVTLDMFFKPAFDPNELPQNSLIPLTISESGLSVGLIGNVGSEDVWYSLAYMGDLNFTDTAYGSISYSAVFDIQTYLNNVSAYKIEFRGGAVDVTSVTTVTATTVTVPLTKSKLLNPGDNILYDVYIYGKVLTIDPQGWIYYQSSTLYRSDLLTTPYTPHLITI